ncbi:MAG: hypothetical protein DWB42_07720 [Chloroflexi bacterium]|jgi:hypothetical protein|nr:hypothetical protein [Chloroflexota bacterium]MDL1883963.1 hypothetical protein [Anaerolineae bacterium CFX8]GIL13602.1 MAG: hypothetical protein BroJett038_23220 [Chloroflexota bacterium]
MSARKFTIDPNKPFFVYDTKGDWHAVKIGEYLWDTRGEYIGFVRGETHDVYTTAGEWVGNLWPDGRIIRKRTYDRPPLLKDRPPKPAKPQNFPARAPLPPMCSELGFDKIDVLDWDDEVFKRVSDLVPDMD